MLTSQEKDLAKKIGKYGLTPDNIWSNLTSNEQRVMANFKLKVKQNQASPYEFQAEIDKAVQTKRRKKAGLGLAGSLLGGAIISSIFGD